MLLQGFLVLDHAVQGTIESILFRHPLVSVQQRRHGCLRKPFFVDGELATRRNESVDHEQFDHFLPSYRTDLPAQRLPPELSEIELLPITCTLPSTLQTAAAAAPPDWREAPRPHPRVPPRPFALRAGR